VSFSVPAMLTAASEETGLDDFGDDEFREALERLVDSTNDDVELSELGTMAFTADTHRTLVNRLRFAADLAENPEITDEDVSDPIVILGMPRTGTTKLQRFISADPGVQRLDYWRLLNPAPFPDAANGLPDPRIAVAREAIAVAAQLMPKWMDSHPTGAEEADEDVFLQLFTFKCVLYYMFRPVPGYQAWMASQSLAGTYRYTRQLLQYLQWQDGGRRDRPWVLKTPVHLGTTDLLLDEHPNATLVFLHRDLHEVIPSHCRLMESTRTLYCPEVDLHEIGRSCVGDFSTEMRKHLKLRETLGDRILDIPYREVVSNPEDVVRRIYRHAGRELGADALAAMRSWDADHPRHHAGSYTYRMEDYGLTTRSIDDAFVEYNSRFAELAGR
jgi:hypothetical protein